MYIEPNTDIILCNAVPLDKTYDHTALFASREAQHDYFYSKRKYVLAHYSYQRANRGMLRVGIRAEHLYDCNYMMFRNSAFGTKWFYAFIDKVEYVNDVTAEITFTIDVMQTWAFDYHLEECWVEREHTPSDEVGEHIMDEGLETGEFVYKSLKEETYSPADCAVIVATSVNVSGGVIEQTPAAGTFYGGIYSGLKYLVFYNENNIEKTVQDVDAYLGAITDANKQESVVSLFMYPVSLLNLNSDGEIVRSVQSVVKNFTVAKQQTTIAGYTPRNKKLLCFPYNRLYVFNDQGNSSEYLFEKFSTDGCAFSVTASINCSPDAVLYPHNYKGVADNYNERMGLSEFPQCSYNIDAYRAWVASRGGKNASEIAEYSAIAGTIGNTLSSAITTVGAFGAAAISPSLGSAAYMSGSLGSTFDAVSNTAGAIGSYMARRSQPPQNRGVSSAHSMFSNGKHGFIFYQCCIQPEYASTLDSFFDKFGYKVNELKIPLLHSRRYYNYVKTRNCNIRGSMPQDDLTAVCHIFDRGITFWHGGEHIGDYEYALLHGNTPVNA